MNYKQTKRRTIIAYKDQEKSEAVFNLFLNNAESIKEIKIRLIISLES